MEHAERRRWCEKISEINEALNSDDAARTVDLRDFG